MSRELVSMLAPSPSRHGNRIWKIEGRTWAFLCFGRLQYILRLLLPKSPYSSGHRAGRGIRLPEPSQRHAATVGGQPSVQMAQAVW
jgi:hypothetical protein